MTGQGRENALDHVVVVVFENRSLDNVLGRLYGPDDGKAFEGVLGKDLSNPIPEWAEHGADRKVAPYTVATDMDTPRDPGTWPVADPWPVPSYIQDALGLGRTLSILGKAAFNGIRAYAEQNHIKIDGLPADRTAEIPPEQALHIIHNFLAIQFPLLHPSPPVVPPQQSKLSVRQP